MPAKSALMLEVSETQKHAKTKPQKLYPGIKIKVVTCRETTSK